MTRKSIVSTEKDYTWSQLKLQGDHYPLQLSCLYKHLHVETEAKNTFCTYFVKRRKTAWLEDEAPKKKICHEIPRCQILSEKSVTHVAIMMDWNCLGEMARKGRSTHTPAATCTRAAIWHALGAAAYTWGGHPLSPSSCSEKLGCDPREGTPSR